MRERAEGSAEGATKSQGPTGFTAELADGDEFALQRALLNAVNDAGVMTFTLRNVRLSFENGTLAAIIGEIVVDVDRLEKL